MLNAKNNGWNRHKKLEFHPFDKVLKCNRQTDRQTDRQTEQNCHDTLAHFTAQYQVTTLSLTLCSLSQSLCIKFSPFSQPSHHFHSHSHQSSLIHFFIAAQHSLYLFHKCFPPQTAGTDRATLWTLGLFSSPHSHWFLITVLFLFSDFYYYYYY